jgi:hypothetical protein
MRVLAVMFAALLALGSLATAQQITQGPPPVTVVATSGIPPTCCAGATTETNTAAVRIPGGSMGPNGTIFLYCLTSYPNSANVKTFQPRLSTTSGATTGGAISAGTTWTTSVISQTQNVVHNQNATNAQVAWGIAQAGITPFGAAGSGKVTLAVDTTVDTFLNINFTTASGAETITLESCTAIIVKAP